MGVGDLIPPNFGGWVWKLFQGVSSMRFWVRAFMSTQDAVRDVIHELLEREVTVSNEGDAVDVHVYNSDEWEIGILREELEEAGFDVHELTQHETNVVRLRVPKESA